MTPPRRPFDPEAVLRELSRRWASARTLEYRSRTTLTHAGELSLTLLVRARLRRPGLARILFDADRPESARLRVCDGPRLWDRAAPAPLRPGRTTMQGCAGSVLADLPHPLDEASYGIGQFFAAAPFVPPSHWGDSDAARTVTGERIPLPAPLAAAAGVKNVREALRIVIARGRASDTLILEPISLRPLELVRVGEHAGRMQELLREVYTHVALGAFLPPPLFRWTEDDDRGATLAAEWTGGKGTGTP